MKETVAIYEDNEAEIYEDEDNGVEIHRYTYSLSDLKEIQENTLSTWPTTVRQEVPKMRYEYKITYKDEDK